MQTEDEIIERLHEGVRTARDFEETTDENASDLQYSKATVGELKENFQSALQKRKFLDVLEQQKHLIKLNPDEVEEKENSFESLKSRVSKAVEEVKGSRKRLRTAVLDVTNYSSRSNSLIQQVCTTSQEKASLEGKLAQGNSLLSEVLPSGESSAEEAKQIEEKKASDVKEKQHELEQLEDEEMQMHQKVSSVIKETIEADLDQQAKSLERAVGESNETFVHRRLSEAAKWFQSIAEKNKAVFSDLKVEIEDDNKAKLVLINGIELSVTFAVVNQLGDVVLQPKSIKASCRGLDDVMEYGIAKGDLPWVLQQVAAFDPTTAEEQISCDGKKQFVS